MRIQEADLIVIHMMKNHGINQVQMGNLQINIQAEEDQIVIAKDMQAHQIAVFQANI